MALSQRQHFIFPAAADKVHDLARSVSRPEDPEHPRPTPYIEPIWQIWLCMLSLDCVSIPWGGRLPRVQCAERCPVAKDPWGHAKLDQTHHVTLDFQRATLTKQWQDMVTDRSCLVVADATSRTFTGLLPAFAKPTASHIGFLRSLTLLLSAPSVYLPDPTR